MSKQVFWDLPLDEQVLKINGTSVTGTILAGELPTVNSAFEVLTDDTDVQVLVIETESPMEIQTSVGGYTSVVADFIGEKPRRPK